MNAIVGFRGNSLGSLSPTPAQRRTSQEQIVSNLRARWEGTMRKALPQAQAPGIAKSGAVATDKAAELADVASPELDRDAFLRLLVMEMQNQDPLEPVDNADMIAQLAQFSSLEQMNNLNASFESVGTGLSALTSNIDQLNFISAQNLLGQQVQGVSEAGELIEGQVDGVHLDGSVVVLNVGGTLMPMSGVLSIGAAGETAAASTTQDTASKAAAALEKRR